MSEKPLISLCMIVKNEEKNLPRCLDSVKGVVDEMIIVDTGSSDKTKEIALSYGAKVYDFEWINDFAAARNYGIDRANGQWIFVIDADEELDSEWRDKIREKLLNTDADAFRGINRNFFVNRMQNILDLPRTYIFRNDPRYRYQQAYHESIHYSLEEYHAKVEDWGYVINHYGTLSNEAQGGNRVVRGVKHMEKVVKENPNSSLHYNYGVELYRAGQYEQSYRVLKQAISQGITAVSDLNMQIGLVVLADLALKKNEYDLVKRCGEAGLMLGQSDLDMYFFSQCAFAYGTIGLADQLAKKLKNDPLPRKNKMRQMTREKQINQALESLGEARKLLHDAASLPNVDERNMQLINKWLDRCADVEIELETLKVEWELVNPQ